MSQESRHIADAGLASVSQTVGTLPAGYNLGEVRYEDKGVSKYRLMYNAGTDQINPGWGVYRYASCGPYSVSITHATDLAQHVGGAIVHHATVATGYYFWGMVRGQAASGVIGAETSTPSGQAFGLLGTGCFSPIATLSSFVPVGFAVATVTTGHTGTAGTRTGNVFIAFE